MGARFVPYGTSSPRILGHAHAHCCPRTPRIVRTKGSPPSDDRWLLSAKFAQHGRRAGPTNGCFSSSGIPFVVGFSSSNAARPGGRVARPRRSSTGRLVAWRARQGAQSPSVCEADQKGGGSLTGERGGGRVGRLRCSRVLRAVASSRMVAMCLRRPSHRGQARMSSSKAATIRQPPSTLLDARTRQTPPPINPRSSHLRARSALPISPAPFVKHPPVCQTPPTAATLLLPHRARRVAPTLHPSSATARLFYAPVGRLSYAAFASLALSTLLSLPST
jgi:hypothetical protein